MDNNLSLESYTLHDLCVKVVNQMVKEGITRHVTYISPEDSIEFGLKSGGKIPKVTVEFVDESEVRSNIGEKE